MRLLVLSHFIGDGRVGPLWSLHSRRFQPGEGPWLWKLIVKPMDRLQHWLRVCSVNVMLCRAHCSHKTGPLLGPGGGQRLESVGLCHQLDSDNCQVTLTLGPAQLADLFLLHFAGCVKPYSDKKQYISLEDDSYFWRHNALTMSCYVFATVMILMIGVPQNLGCG